MDYFDIKITRLALTDNGEEREFKENYIVLSETVTTAEERIKKEVSDPVIVSAKKIKCETGSGDGKYWYKARVSMLIVTDSGTEKNKTQVLFVSANDINTACKSIEKYINESMADCELLSVSKTNITDILE